MSLEDRSELESSLVLCSEEDEDEDELVMQDKLLEELLRLRLSESHSVSGVTSVGSSSVSAVAAAAGAPSSSSLLPPKQRLKLFQPRSKFEQFKDILHESQLRRHICEKHSNRSTAEGSAKEEEELGLRAAWFHLKDAISGIYSGILSGSTTDTTMPPTSEMEAMQERVAQLTWKDPHQLFVRLESGIREFVIDLKLLLIELLQKQAKNPSLAQDFIQSLLDGYEKICTAAAYVSPALQELEMSHLQLFGLTWEVMNKHLYQSIIYTDPLIQNNLPIFISQLRSLYPDKEHEARYTELVRSYLDFDVEMEKIGAFWKISEPLIANYNKEQVILMEKQKMLREDWEKFKMQRKAIDKQLKEEESEGDNAVSSDAASQSDDKSDENTEGSKENEECECHACTSLASISQTLSKCAIADSAPNCPSPPVPSSASNLDLYPHIHGSSDLSSTTPTITTTTTTSSSCSQNSDPSEHHHRGESVPKEEEAVNGDYSNCVDESPEEMGNDVIEDEDETKESLLNQDNDNMCSSAHSNSVNNASTSKTNATSTCSGGGSSKRKVCSAANHGNSREINKLLQQHYCGHKKAPSSSSSSVAARKGKVPPEEDEDLSEDEDTCSSASADSKHCSCCYCEVFGHGGPSVAPVSRNYPEMRERLRLLLNKKKKCKQQQGQTKAPLMEGRTHQASQEVHRVPPTVPHPISTSASASKIPDKAVKSSKRIESSTQSSKSGSRVSKSASQPNLNDLKTKDVEEILEYIEGNLKTTSNEKKRAKKDRQKQQRLEEQRRREEEERQRKEREEAERRRVEEEMRRDQERAHQLLKKRTKKEKQKAKKAAAKGGLPLNETPDFQKDAAQKLEELKAQHLREVEQLKLIQQQQLEETQRSLLLQHQRTQPPAGPPQSSVSYNLKQALSTTASGNAAGSKSGKQVRITRTPNGGVEFSTVEDEEPKCPATNSSLMSASSPPALSTASMAFANNGMMFKPSIPSLKPASNQPMVTIKRVHTGDGESTVTISTKPNSTPSSSSENSQLLYTLINGQVHKSQHAPANLLPGAKTLKSASSSSGDGEAGLHLSKKQRKKLRKQFKSVEELRSSPPASDVPNKSSSSLKGLPTTPEGKLDLDNLNLPPGISITRIEGPVPERKYYPSKQEKPQETAPPPILPAGLPSGSPLLPPMFPGGLSPNGTPVGYSAMAGMPSSLNGPNVIVVDTSTLSTRDEEEEEENNGSSSKKGGGNKKKNKKAASGPTPHQNPPVSFPGFLQPEIPSSSPKLQEFSSSSMMSNHNSNNNSSGPQVLIKNVNGQVVITPVPGTGATVDSIPTKLNGSPAPSSSSNNSNKKSKNKGGKENQVAKVVLMKNNANLSSAPSSINTAAAPTNGHHHHPLSSSSEEILSNGHGSGGGGLLDNHVDNPTCQKKKNKKSKKKNSIGENIDEINSIFAPKDIDLENGEIDDDEREIEAFKRFCFNSVPLQQKTKVNFDVKNIAFKKK